MNRRRFFGALAGLAAAVTFKGKAPVVPVDEFTGLPKNYQPLGYSGTTVRTGLPPVYWRALNTYDRDPILEDNELLDELKLVVWEEDGVAVLGRKQ